MKNTTTVVIAAGLILAAVIVTRTPAQQGMAAGVGDPCPSDIDNDAMVGINDFLILLGDWGPCPTPKVIAVATSHRNEAKWAVRLWSSGLVEVRRITEPPNNCWDCTEAWPPPFVWIDYGTPTPPSPEAKPVDLVSSLDRSGELTDLVVGYSDGTIFRTPFGAAHLIACDGFDISHCELEAPLWEPLP